MERYRLIKEVGDGSFGNVWRAVNKESGEIVAIKKMKKKYYSWEECINLQEIKSLRKMNHPNIVKLKEVIREHDELYFIFEYLECNLYQFMKDREKPFSETEIRNWCFQVFQALAYMHQQGYFHRDLKPENLLLYKDAIKVADFAWHGKSHLSHRLQNMFPLDEVLLHSSVYGPAVDLWAMGAIMAELFNLRPLFPGLSEADEIHKICRVIGSPCQKSWAEGLYLADAINFNFPQYPGAHLSLLIPSASDYAIGLISSLCSWDPSRRPTAAKALQHPFFQPCYYIPPSLRMRSPGFSRTPSVGFKGTMEQQSGRRYYPPIGALTSSKLSSPIICTSSRTGAAQRMLDMNQHQDHVVGEKRLEQVVPAQPRYRPPPRNNPGHLARVGHGDPKEKMAQPTLSSGRAAGVVTEKLANLTLKGGAQPVRPSPPAPSLKAGGWLSHTQYINQSCEITPARSYPRKVVG
ncbi:hypothetical protein HPP92_002504 [Vanilla planifolia]|uniref:Protein kinase domain-containing protein n=1 Tax=Vanilla planifolia TaxID=51239 RepID=A0A835VI13_VANPL|nr:hypothetical protein HPP92_002504 [Vanilla planifolia]